LSSFRSISDGSDGVVKAGSAGSRVENTTGVHLEDGFVSLNGDGSWLFGNGGLKLSNRSGWDIAVVLNINLSGSLVSMAR